MTSRGLTVTSRNYSIKLRTISIFTVGFLIFGIFEYAPPVHANTLASCLRVSSAQFKQDPTSITYEVFLSSVCDPTTTTKLDGAWVDLYFGIEKMNLLPQYYYSRLSNGLVKFQIDTYQFKKVKPGLHTPRIDISKLMAGQVFSDKISFNLPAIRAIDPVDCFSSIKSTIRTASNSANISVSVENQCLDSIDAQFFDYSVKLRVPKYKKLIMSQDMLLFPNVFDTLRNKFNFDLTGLAKGTYRNAKVVISPRYSLLDTPTYEKRKTFNVPAFTIK